MAVTRAALGDTHVPPGVKRPDLESTIDCTEGPVSMAVRDHPSVDGVWVAIGVYRSEMVIRLTRPQLEQLATVIHQYMEESGMIERVVPGHRLHPSATVQQS